MKLKKTADIRNQPVTCVSAMSQTTFMRYKREYELDAQNVEEITGVI